MKKPTHFIIALFLLNCLYAPAQWSSLAQAPVARWGASACYHDAYSYLIGGDAGSGPTGLIQRFKPSSGTWQTLTTMPTVRTYAAAVAATNNKIYVFGGNQGSLWLNTVEEFDPFTHIWTTKASMPCARMGLAAAEYNGRIYVIGGWNGSMLNSCDIYDIATDSWSTGPAMPHPVFQMQAAAISNRIYVVGGFNGGGVRDYNQVLDAQTLVWTTEATLTTPRYLHGVAAANGKIFAIGGFPNTGVVESYDPANGVWSTETSLTVPRTRVSASSDGTCVYVAGGFTTSPSYIHESFCQLGPLDAGSLELTLNQTENALLLNWKDNYANGLVYELEMQNPSGEVESIARLNGIGTTQYSFSFHNSFQETCLFRVSSIDPDGGVRRSEWVPYYAGSEKNAWFRFITLPGGAKGTEVFFPGDNAWLGIQILDLQGKLMWENRTSTPQSGAMIFSLPEHLPSGQVWVIKLSNGRQMLSGKAVWE